MTRLLFAVASVLVSVPTIVKSQGGSIKFSEAAYVTCREAHAMQAEPRKALALYLAEHASRHRGVTIPDGAQGAQLAHLVRGGCTLAPDAYLFTVIDRAIVAELQRLPKRN